MYSITCIVVLTDDSNTEGEVEVPELKCTIPRPSDTWSVVVSGTDPNVLYNMAPHIGKAVRDTVKDMCDDESMRVARSR